MNLVVIALVVAGAAGAAGAAPWRGGLEIGLGSYRSYATDEPRIIGGGVHGAVFVERALTRRRDLSGRLTLDVEIVGPLTLRSEATTYSPADSGILVGRLSAGVAWHAHDPWTMTAAIGLGRELYFSREVTGDSGLTLVWTIGIERAIIRPRWWRLMGVARLSIQLDPQPSSQRWAIDGTLGLGMVLGR